MPINATKTVTAASTVAATSSVWIPLDQYATPFNVGFGVRTSGNVTYRMEHTFQKTVSGRDNSVEVFIHADVSAQTSAKDGNYAFPIYATRLTVVSGLGKATVDLWQTGY